MKSRDELLETLKAECAEKLSTVARSKNYADLMKKLIVQGLVKIEEGVVEVQCRAEDVATANRVVSCGL
jgi:V-type H+-transporting ATPase subunit E